jgi:hypothetical protein
MRLAQIGARKKNGGWRGQRRTTAKGPNRPLGVTHCLQTSPKRLRGGPNRPPSRPVRSTRRYEQSPSPHTRSTTSQKRYSSSKGRPTTCIARPIQSIRRLGGAQSRLKRSPREHSEWTTRPIRVTRRLERSRRRCNELSPRPTGGVVDPIVRTAFSSQCVVVVERRKSIPTK